MYSSLGNSRRRVVVIAAAVVGMVSGPIQGQEVVDEGGSSTGALPAAGLHGTVVEVISGQPIARARIWLVAGERDRSTWSDQDGGYRFDDVSPGRYRLRVERVGYRAVELGLTLPVAGTVERSVGMAVEPLGLEAIRVRGAAVPFGSRLAWRPGGADGVGDGRRDRAASDGAPTLDARTLGHRQIESLSTLGEPDVFRALQRTPGVSARGDYSADLWVRSAPWGMTAVLLDGLPLYDPLHLGGSVSGMASDALESATILPGVRPTALARGAAATIQLQTRTAGEEPVRAFALSPLALRGTLEDRVLGDRVGLAVTARRSWWDWVQPPGVFASGDTGGPIDYHLGDLTARVDARLPGGLTLDAAGLHQTDALDGDIPGVVSDSRARWGNRAAWMSLGRASAADTWSARVMAGHSTHRSWTRSRPWSSFIRRPGPPSLAWMDLDLDHAVMRIEAEGRDPAGPLRWGAGVERVRESLAQSGIEAVDREAPGADRPVRLSWWRGWGELAYAGERVEASAGWAYDRASGAEAPDMGGLGNARLRLRPLEWLAVEGAWGQARQTSYPLARSGGSVGPALGVGHVWMLAGRDVPVLDSETATLSAELRLPADFGVEATLWQRRISGILMNGAVTIRDGDLWTPLMGRDQGVEAGRGWELSVYRAAGRVTGGVSYSRGRSEIRGSEGARWASPAERKHSVNAALDLALGRGVGVTALYSWESGWPYAVGPWECEESDGCEIPMGDPLRPSEHRYERAPDYRSLDLRTSWTRRGERAVWEVAVSLRNALAWGNVQAWRPLGCRGRAEISAVCSQSVGVGRFATGPDGPTPALSFQVRF